MLYKCVCTSGQQSIALTDVQSSRIDLSFLSQAEWPAEMSFLRNIAFPFEMPKANFICFINHFGETFKGSPHFSV